MSNHFCRSICKVLEGTPRAFLIAGAPIPCKSKENQIAQPSIYQLTRPLFLYQYNVEHQHVDCAAVILKDFLVR